VKEKLKASYQKERSFKSYVGYLHVSHLSIKCQVVFSREVN